MYADRDFDPADPDESEVYSFDFVKELAPGESISSAVWTCIVASDSEASDGLASSRLSGAPTNAGTISSHRVIGLLTGVKYVLQAVVTTSASNLVALHSHVTSRDPS